MTRNKTTTAIAIILILAFAISFVELPTTNAADTMQTFAFIGATPNPVGVGQEVLLHVGITQQLSNVNLGWEGLSVTITTPDGTTETLSNIRTDSTGGTGRTYIPTKVGNYTFQTHFPQQTMPTIVGSIPAGTTMLASDSRILTLVVQQEAISYNPGVPLPTEYWTRPINSQFREWYTVSGSSWMSNEYNDAPDTPHILWTKPLTNGGLVGGSLGEVGSGATSVGMENGDAYEGKWQGSIILAGRLYYQDAPGTLYAVATQGSPVLYHCVDLRTGEEYWAKTFLDNRTLSFGQLFYWQSYNYQGTFAYLWVTVGSTWYAFDPFTGDPRATITNVPSGTRMEGPRGEEYVYQVNQEQGWMALWNMSALVSMAGSWGSAFAGRTFNASATTSSGGLTTAAARAWAWNITIPKGLPGSVRAVKLDDKVVGMNLEAPGLYRSSAIGVTGVNVWAFSLKSGQEGHLLYNTTWQAPANWANLTLTLSTTDIDSNIGLVRDKEECTWVAFSLENGQYLWTSDPEYYLSIYSSRGTIYDGKLYASGMTGLVYCYDLATGERLWTQDVRDPYQAEILWSDNWPETLLFAQGGKLYFFHSEHSANQPLPRGAPALCLNATTGEVLWRVNGLFRKTDWGGGPIMGDSVIAMYNTYDQQVYAIGKGPSATTVMAPLTEITVGEKVIIQGTVTDASPGTEQTAVKLRFPNGVAAVSDDSVGEWMKYVYVDFPRPANATGVEVTIDAVDPNNNFVHLGTATSDSSGTFGFGWVTPDVPGKYTIIATFGGSGAYYPSFAETYAIVTEAPASTPSPTSTPVSMAEQYFMPMSVGMIIAIVVVIALLAMVLLRKRA
jgi:hypothetical protein